jgi:metallo-beta-lactamase family protein
LGEEYKLKAQVVTVNGFSAHADRDELLNWTGYFKTPPAHTFVVHGEEEASVAFAEALREQGMSDVNVPELGQSFTI